MSSVDLALVGSLEKLMQVQHELDGVKEQTVAKIRRLKDKYNKKQWERLQQQQNDQVQMSLYKQSQLLFFMSDYALRRRLNEVDKKITKFLNSVVVEGCPYSTSECTITLNFDENPYFQNSSLTKKLWFSHEGIVDASGTTITWKISKGITAGLEEKWSEQSHTDMNKRFFTWFCKDSKKELHDQVANSIACDLWRYAPNYFVNE